MDDFTGTGLTGALCRSPCTLLGSGSVSRRHKRSSGKRKRRHSQSKRKRSHKRMRRTPYTAGKRKDTSRRRIRYTKNGQPYILVAGGKARFISKKSAKTRRKRSGGSY